MPAPRMKNLFNEIDKCKPESIIEIGVWDGENALRMIKYAQEYHNEIAYYGFDLFERITDEEIIQEHSKKRNKQPSLIEITKKLTFNAPIAKITLFQGYTKETIPKANIKGPIDFIFIDGGHSIETIKSDWKNIQRFIHKETVIIFDDYYKNNNKLGCKSLIDSLDQNKWSIEIFELTDIFEKIGWRQYTQIVKVVIL